MKQALGWDRELLIPEKSEKVPGADWTFQQTPLMEGVMCEPRAEGQVAKRKAEFQETTCLLNAEVVWPVGPLLRAAGRWCRQWQLMAREDEAPERGTDWRGERRGFGRASGESGS